MYTASIFIEASWQPGDWETPTSMVNSCSVEDSVLVNLVLLQFYIVFNHHKYMAVLYTAVLYWQILRSLNIGYGSTDLLTVDIVQQKRGAFGTWDVIQIRSQSDQTLPDIGWRVNKLNVRSTWTNLGKLCVNISILNHDTLLITNLRGKNMFFLNH